MGVNTAYAPILTASSAHAMRGISSRCAAIETMPVAMTSAK